MKYETRNMRHETVFHVLTLIKQTKVKLVSVQYNGIR